MPPTDPNPHDPAQPVGHTGLELAEFLERMSGLLAAAALAPDGPPGTPPGGLVAPMPALDAPARRFAEVYGPAGESGNAGLLGTLADAQADPALAALMRALDQALQSGALTLAPTPAPAPRLARFVYPVV